MISPRPLFAFFSFLFFIISILETRSHCVVQAILKLMVLPPRRRNYRQIPTLPLFIYRLRLRSYFSEWADPPAGLWTPAWALSCAPAPSLDCSSSFPECPPLSCPFQIRPRHNRPHEISRPSFQLLGQRQLGRPSSADTYSVVTFSFSFPPPSPGRPGAAPVANTMTAQSNWPINVSLV